MYKIFPQADSASGAAAVDHPKPRLLRRLDFPLALELQARARELAAQEQVAQAGPLAQYVLALCLYRRWNLRLRYGRHPRHRHGARRRWYLWGP
jgi:hypothetical protein